MNAERDHDGWRCPCGRYPITEDSSLVMGDDEMFRHSLCGQRVEIDGVQALEPAE